MESVSTPTFLQLLPSSPATDSATLSSIQTDEDTQSARRPAKKPLYTGPTSTQSTAGSSHGQDEAPILSVVADVEHGTMRRDTSTGSRKDSPSCGGLDDFEKPTRPREEKVRSIFVPI